MRTHKIYVSASDLWVDRMQPLPLLLLALLMPRKIFCKKNASVHNKFKDFCHSLRSFFFEGKTRIAGKESQEKRLRKWEALLYPWMDPK